MKLDPNEPAYPKQGTPVFDAEGRPQNPYGGYGWSEAPQPGLTIRSEFAKAAMQGLLASLGKEWSMNAIINESVAYADALIAELNKEETK